MTFRVTAVGRMPGGEEWQNVWHFTGTPGAGDPEVDQAFDNVSGFYEALLDRLNDGWHLDKLRMALVNGPTLREDVITGGADGTATGAPMPNDCSILVQWTTASPARTARGRTFLGGWLSSAVVANGAKGAGIVDSGPAGAIKDAATAFLAASGPAPVVYSRTLGSEEDITGGSVSRRWSTQRRRDLDTPRALLTFP